MSPRPFAAPAAAALLLLHSPCLASRPFVTEDAGVAGPGARQVEVSWDALSDRNRLEHVLAAAPSIGLGTRLELSAQVPLRVGVPAAGRRASGPGDLGLAAKLRVRDPRGAVPALALVLAGRLATASEASGLGSGYSDASLIAAASLERGGTAVHAMFGHTLAGAGHRRGMRDACSYGLAVERPWTKNVRAVAELAGNGPPDREASRGPLTALAGATVTVTPACTVDAGIRLGLDQAAPRWNTALGLTLAW